MLFGLFIWMPVEMASDLYVILINRLGRNENGLYSVLLSSKNSLFFYFTSEKKKRVCLFSLCIVRRV